MLNLPYKLAAFAIYSIILVIVAWYSGYSHVRTADKVATAAQNERTALVEQKQTTISEDVAEDFTNAIHSLDSRYSFRVRDDGGQVPRLSKPAPRANAAPAQSGPSAPGVAPDSAECQALKENAARDALQVLYWQDWARREGVAGKTK